MCPGGPPLTMLYLKGTHLDGYDGEEEICEWYGVCEGLDVSGSLS